MDEPPQEASPGPPCAPAVGQGPPGLTSAPPAPPWARN